MLAAPELDLARYHLDLNKLCSIALSRLPRMIDPASGLVVFRVSGAPLVPTGTSFRYTAITALGLDRAEAHGLPCSVDLERLYEALSATLAGVDNSGDLGLVLWAAARNARPLAERALAALLEFKGNVRRRGGAVVHSTELAWIVTGLAEALAAGVGPERELRARLDRAFRQLLRHRGASGLVCFARPLETRAGGGLQRTLHAHLGFFDAQVYTLLAALRFDAVVGDPTAREVAERIGALLLAHQHPLGQWGWHYNVQTGGLVDLYPVYSVHQDGMAPMALLPLESALGVPTTAAVARGLRWLFGGNELSELMAVHERAVIWRSIRRRAPLRRVLYPLKAISLAGLGEGRDLGARLAGRSMLEVDREMRPYHLGWCLYAFSALAAATRALAGEPGRGEPHESGDFTAQARGTRASNPA